jgi:glutathione S-transferase
VRLFYTPLSHFSRKVRILCAELGVELELARVPSVLEPSPDAYGDNPLMRVPTLVDGDVMLLESDHIARHIVRTHDPADRLGVRSEDPRDLNRLAVANGIMANEVVLILAKRGGLEDIESVAYFRKLLGAMERALAWLDADVELDLRPDARFDYAAIAMICMWQHVLHYKLVAGDRYERIAARVAQLADRPSVASTTPERSLADADAAVSVR